MNKKTFNHAAAARIGSMLSEKQFLIERECELTAQIYKIKERIESIDRQIEAERKSVQ